MIPHEKARAYIDSLEKIVLTKDSFSKFSKPYETLGLIVSRLCNPKATYNFNYKALYIEAFGDDVAVNPWQTKEGQQLASTLFGTIRAPYIADVWKLLDTLPYQKGYNRRSFRRKPDSSFIAHKIQTLQFICSSGVTAGFGVMSFKEQLQYDVYYQNGYHTYLFAVVLEKGEENLDELVSDIINNEDDITGITRQFIKALLLTTNPKNWELVGKLLLAAQRQEGLRQTILECLDETQIGALQYLIKLILDNDLMRFSSVVRAVDCWFGFGWDAPKKATIKRTLELANQFLEHPKDIELAIDSKDFLEVYVALWAQGVTDVTVANKLAFSILFNTQQKDRKLLALFFIYETERTQYSLVDFLKTELGKDVEVDYWMLKNMPVFELTDDLFNRIKTLAEALPAKGKTFESVVFSWKNYTITPDYFYNQLINKASENQLERLCEDISSIPSDIRRRLVQKLFPKHYTYSYYAKNAAIEKVPLETAHLGWKRNLIHQTIQDRNESVMATGIKLFRALDLQETELQIIDTLLMRKNKNLRKACIQILAEQPEAVVKQSTTQLVQSKKIDQRLAGLELLTILNEKPAYTAFVESHISEYTARPNLHKNEEVFLDKMAKTSDSNTFSFANGFGAIDYDNLSPLVIPQKRFEQKTGIISGLLGKKERLITRFIDEEKTVKQTNELINLLNEYKDYEYQVESYKGEIRTCLIAKTVTGIKKLENATATEHLHNLPLAQQWIKWYKDSKLNDYELQAAIHYSRGFINPYSNYALLVPYLKNYIPNLEQIKYEKDYYHQTANRNVETILQHLLNAYADLKTLNAFKTDLLEDAIANFPEDLKTKNLDTNKWRHNDLFWCDAMLAVGYFSVPQLSKRMWDMTRYLMAQSIGHPKHITHLKEVLHTPPKKQNFHRTSEFVTFPLFEKGEITKDDVLLEAIFSNSHHGLLLDSQFVKNKQKWFQDLNPPFAIFKDLKKNLLQVELERGELETEATRLVINLQFVEGIDYLFEALTRMGKANFERGYSHNQLNKSSVFSRIIKKCIPAETDTYEQFVSKIETEKITKKRLIEVACYATQWAQWIGQYLKISELESAVWWFHAHSSEYMNAEKETVISRYSNVPMHEFKIGSLDINWFYKVYENLGKSNWKLLHEASKYISDGFAHKLVKLYSAVLLGEIKITETLKKVNDKRDKDYVRALGLVPLSKTKPEADLLKRYDLLQTFLKESKQFGAQRQESEKNAVEIGLENLARNAGYSDSIRFGWAMESKAAQQIMENSVVIIEETKVELVVNDAGKADILVEKNGKAQMSIPKALQKNKAIIQLKEAKSYLSKQYSRARLSLENAMINEDAFAKAELKNIMKHPIVKPMLSKLVLCNTTTNVSGFWNDGTLVNFDNKTHTLSDEDALVIAHPSHLYTSVQWDVYQRFLFENSIVQPFKQVFRELYVITENERETSTRSERYQGHQIQPKKTIALLRSRGWTVNYQEGLQKVYHKHGFMASMYAMADWYSPADVEAPTLEYVTFTALKDYKPIPLAAINPLIFSEIMRDVDLVVSVAHVGGIDPEASHSTMQMRAVLAKESARLFKLNNIEVKERHILIKGTLGDYNIHLGSGNVSKDSLFLSIIPVHSQHLGRLFLPFIDDDPKTAEIISKMKLLAEDDKIQDPTVLAQINR